MTPGEREAARRLASCRLPPASWAKRFARSMAAIAEKDPGRELSEKQRLWLWKLCHRFRQQMIQGSKRMSDGQVREYFERSYPADPRDLAAWLAWNGGTVRKLAEAIREGRRFDELGILAEALEEAGCADPEILDHLRSPHGGWSFCWVLDLLLGRP